MGKCKASTGSAIKVLNHDICCNNFNDFSENELIKLFEVIVEDTQFVYYYTLQ